MSQLDHVGDPDFMMSLARGLAVLRCVAEAHRPVTIADVVRRTELSRASVRRSLYTLAALGYVGQTERGYMVRRQALALGHPFLSLNALATRAQPLLDTLRDDLGESCSLGIMEEDQLYYVARGEATRIMSVGLRVGSRLPLYCTSMGRVLLSGRSDEEQEAYLVRAALQPLTPRTVTAPQQLLVLLRSIRRDGFALVDQELEVGLRSIAVPVRQRGRVVAALNVGTSAQRVSLDDMRRRFLPKLFSAAELLGTSAE